MDYISIIKVYKKHTFWEEISSRLQVFDCWWLCHNQGLLPPLFGEALKKETDVFCQENASCEDPVPLLRHILYVRNVPSEHAGMGSNTLWQSLKNGWDGWELQCCAS